MKWLSIAALLALSSLPSAQAGTADSVPVIVPEVAVYDDSIWIGYNVCPVAVLGPPEGCSGPYRLAEVPIGSDPCRYAGNAPGLCGNPLPSTDVCDYQSVAYPCKGDLCHPTGTADVCNPPCSVGTVDFCDGNCRVGNVNPCYDPCRVGNLDWCDPCNSSLTDDVPGTCGNPLPDECAYAGNAPGLCGNPLPSTDVCDYQSVAYPCKGDLCHPTGTTDVCNPPCSVGTVDFCDGNCRVGNVNPCYDPCRVGNLDWCDPCNSSLTDDVPGTCGNPLPETDPCGYAPTAPGLCQPVDTCQPAGPAVDVCNPPPIPIIIVDGELCIAKQNLDGSGYQRIYCLPINR